MNKEFIKNLQIFNSFLERIFPTNNQEDKIQHFEVIEDDKKHIYETGVEDVIFEGISRVGMDYDKSNCADSFVVMSHPKDSQYKFMMVVDGKGYVTDSQTKKVKTTADYIVDGFKKWFKNLDEETLTNFNASGFNKTLNNCMKKMHTKLQGIKGDHGTKMIMAVIGPEQTLIANLGDLRCYLEKDLNVVQYNEEDSLLWRQFREGYFWDKEEFRFRKAKTKEVAQFGKTNDSFTSTYVIDNSIYDRIYLFSRGVIECLSEDRMNIINSDMPAERVVDTIIAQATDGTKESMSFYEGNYKELEEVVHGSKNSTACVYMKRK